MLDFAGRVAIVTGAGKGMGREHADMLASRGACVVVNDVAADDADAAVVAIRSAGGQAAADYSDVARGAGQLVQSAIDAFGRLDILVNNAGIIRVGLFSEQDPRQWWNVFDVSLRGTVEAHPGGLAAPCQIGLRTRHQRRLQRHARQSGRIGIWCGQGRDLGLGQHAGGGG